MMFRAGLTDGLEEGFYAIARMTEHDLLDVVEIENDSGLSIWGWDAYRAELERVEAVMLVAVEGVGRGVGGSRVAGFVAARINADELHINNIGVREEHRRRGLGTTLLASALMTGRALGAAESVLEVRASNLAAQALYSKAGFKTVGRRKSYYKNPSEDALIMTKPLDAKS